MLPTRRVIIHPPLSAQHLAPVQVQVEALALVLVEVRHSAPVLQQVTVLQIPPTAPAARVALDLLQTARPLRMVAAVRQHPQLQVSHSKAQRPPQ